MVYRGAGGGREEEEGRGEGREGGAAQEVAGPRQREGCTPRWLSHDCRAGRLGDRKESETNRLLSINGFLHLRFKF